MGEGNGKSAVASMETGCPINPGMRPSECGAIHDRLQQIERKVDTIVDDHGQALARIEAKLGMKPRPSKPRPRSKRR